MAKRSLTPEQDMVFGQIERAMLPAFEDAWTKLTVAGFEADEDTIYCTSCDCEQFIHRRGSPNCGRRESARLWPENTRARAKTR
jgi:hypothetical protein